MANVIQDCLRALPAVDAVLKDPSASALINHYGHSETVAVIRETLDSLRNTILKGSPPSEAIASSLLDETRRRLEVRHRPHLRRVVNATGIILHTGLGRAAMPDSARIELDTVTGYCNLQQDLETGQRDHREDCLRDLVKDLLGVEDVLVVNNNAGATLLVLAALARGKEVVISRGELIEIGGSFRLPDIMGESGAILREVGTTNKTHLRDYETATGPQTGLILKAHKSNYKIIGFSKEIGIAEIVTAGHKQGVPVVDDLGCGALIGLEQFGLQHEGTVQESLAAGADIVLFSTDKLIGGPQGGMIVGRADLLARIRSHPLYRALRVCKLTLGALEGTLRLFKAPDLLTQRHPIYMMLGKTVPQMRTQAETVATRIRAIQPGWTVTVTDETSYLGGGTLPEEGMPSCAVRIKTPGIGANGLALHLRMASVPIVGRIHDEAVVLDMRTVFPADHEAILTGVKST